MFLAHLTHSRFVPHPRTCWTDSLRHGRDTVGWEPPTYTETEKQFQLKYESALCWERFWRRTGDRQEQGPVTTRHTSRGRGQGTPLCHPSTETRPLPRCRELLSRIPWGLLGVYSLTYLFRGLITVNEREILYSLSPLRMITGKIRCRLTLPHIFETNGREFVGNFLRKWPIAFVFIAARSDSALLTHVMFFTFVCWCYYFLNSYPTQKR